MSCRAKLNYGSRPWFDFAHHNSNSLAISATTNRITDTGYTYDENGNLTAEPSPVSASYAYDAENRVVSSTVGGNSGAYVYDGSALRVKKCVPNCTSPTTTTIYVFSGSKVIAEYENGAAVNAPTREYIYLGAQVLAKDEGGTLTYYHPDHLSNRVMTNTSGGITAQSAHYPFGENWYDTTSGGPQKLKFTSYERDAESGNDYAIFRSYINRFGRFSGPDPLSGSPSSPQSLNRFAYALNDPINRIDPLGLYSVCMPYVLAMDGMPMAGTVHMHCWPAEDTRADRLLREKLEKRIRRARDEARKLLSDEKCAEFLKDLLVSLGFLPDLDNFLKLFDALDIVPSPRGDSVTTEGFDAHVDNIGSDRVVHVDRPSSPHLPQTLLHEVFHTNGLGVTDAGLAFGVSGSFVTPGPGITRQQAKAANSATASKAFNDNCKSK